MNFNSKVNQTNNSSSLDGYIAIQNYVNRIIQGDGKCNTGMKALILDSTTTQIVSAVYSQTEILRQQVYLVSRLDKLPSSKNNNNNNSSNGHFHNPNDDIDQLNNHPNDTSHLKAIVFIRPTSSNIDLLCIELQKPKYIEYHIYVTGTLDSGLIRLLGEHDIYEKVIQVQEFYADYVPINEDLVTLQCRQTIAMSIAAGTSWAPKYAIQYERNLIGLQSILLSMKKVPTIIRYAASSPCSEEIAKDIYDTITSDDIYHFRSSSNNIKSKLTSPIHTSHGNNNLGSGNNPNIPLNGGLLLLILDRRDDPVTPLLSQWTYQAMVHELLGLNNHRVILKGAPNISKELEEVVLNASEDTFFKTNRYSNFGELGESIQHLLQEYQKQTQQHNTSNLNTIEDMQAFMEKFPELRNKSHVVSKHVAIMSELARIVDICSLLDVSQFEQSLACNDDHNNHWRELMEKLSSISIKIPDKLRLGLLYCLRYESSGNIHMVQNAMIKGGVSNDMVSLIPTLLRYAGIKSGRGPGLYGDTATGGGATQIMSKMTKSFITSVQGIQNVYAQHIPVLMDTIQLILKGKLSSKHYPVLVLPSSTSTATNNRTLSHQNSTGNNNNTFDYSTSFIPDEILIYMVGGVTYEEGTKIAEFNEQQRTLATTSTNNRTIPIVRILLAGSTVHNSTSFLDELKETNNNPNSSSTTAVGFS